MAMNNFYNFDNLGNITNSFGDKVGIFDRYGYLYAADKVLPFACIQPYGVITSINDENVVIGSIGKNEIIMDEDKDPFGACMHDTMSYESFGFEADEIIPITEKYRCITIDLLYPDFMACYIKETRENRDSVMVDDETESAEETYEYGFSGSPEGVFDQEKVQGQSIIESINPLEEYR
jgi:hypothetical protein